jgi:N-acetylgalactosamine-6-sulfatase
MTGRYPSRFGVNSVFGGKNPGPEMPDWLDGNAPTTARYLKAAGYHTAHFGKWHMGEMPDNPPMADYGFDESAVYHGPGENIKPHEIADRAAAYIEANKDHPFFLDVWIHESHTAHDPTPDSLEKWKHLNDEQKQVYAAVIADGDNNVGKVLAAVESPFLMKWVGAALLDLHVAVPGVGGFSVAGQAARTSSPPVINNRSLYVSPQRHTWADRDSSEFPVLAL